MPQSTRPLNTVIRVWALALFTLLLLAVNSRADQFDTLRLYWQSNLVNTGSSVSSVTSTANGYWNSMNTNSSRTYLWSDLPFASVSANLVSTFQRLQAMAQAWATPGSSLQNNSGLASAVAGGLDWMVANVYTTTATEYDNWFHWEISGPQALNDTAVLLYPALTALEITNYFNAEQHYAPGGSGATYGWMTGANTSDKVEVAVISGILTKNAAEIALGQTNLSPVFLYVTTSDGFYTDGSFVFHGNIAYNGHYGLVLLGDIPNLVNLLYGSTWQITDPNLTNVYNWVSNSFEPIVYNNAVMDMFRGRIVSWSYETESEDASSTISAVRGIAQFAPTATATALNNWANSPHVAIGQYHFASNDRVVALRSGYAFGISMSSTRIANYESINSGNLHGWCEGDGMTYLYLGSGTETQFSSDFWPTIDPDHLPGTTVEQISRANSAGEATVTSQNWVGGAQVAKTFGIAGMSLAAYNTTLVGKKSWFMLDNEIVCLGAGITCGGGSEIDTTVENRRLGTSPTNNFWINGTKITPTIGWSSNLTSASWCALDGVGGYYFPGGATNLYAAFAASTGTWAAINSGDSGTSYTDDYLQLWFNSGIKPTNATYAYVLLPNMTSSTVSSYAASPDIVVLTNTPLIQAVRKPLLGVVAANFWTNGSYSADLITANNKASIITWETTSGISAGVSDPTQVNTGSITVTLNRPAVGLVSADAGVTVLQLSPEIVFTVNVNGSAGKSYQASFSYSNSILPVITGVYPNGTNMFQPASALTFNAASLAGVAIYQSNIIVSLSVTNLLGQSYATNITYTNGLQFTGSSTNWNVSCPLFPNSLYRAAATVTDSHGNAAGFTVTFDTCNPGFIWEAEDYDYNNDNFYPSPATDEYSGLGGTEGIDTHAGKITEGTLLYRPSGLDTEVNSDEPRLNYINSGLADYDVGWNDSGNWGNYTRFYPAGTYNIFLRAADGSTTAGSATLSVVSSGVGTTNQSTTSLGTFSIPSTGGWQNWTWIPLRNSSSNLVQFTGGSQETLRLTSGGEYNANFFALFPAISPPVLTNIFPNGAAIFQSTNTLAFSLTSLSGVSAGNVVVILNGVTLTNLQFSGTSNNWTISYPHLLPNRAYTLTITATDVNGYVTTSTETFDTFSSAYYSWEAEDFDYGGHFIDNPQTNGYRGFGSITNEDTHQVNFGGAYLYRTTGMDTEVNGDIVRPQYSGNGYTDYSLGYFSAGAWADYTRHFPAGSYNIYARLAAGGGATACNLAQVTGGWGTTNQTTNFLGTFSVANTAWESYSFVPLLDNNGNLVTAAFNGSTNTLRLGRPYNVTSDCNANFLLLAPVFDISASMSGSTNVGISFPTQSGFNYQVQFKNHLTDPVWSPLGSAVGGNNAVQTVNDPVSNTRFYRVQIQ